MFPFLVRMGAFQRGQLTLLKGPPVGNPESCPGSIFPVPVSILATTGLSRRGHGKDGPELGLGHLDFLDHRAHRALYLGFFCFLEHCTCIVLYVYLYT